MILCIHAISWSVMMRNLGLLFTNVETGLFPCINPRYFLNTKDFFVLQSQKEFRKKAL